MVNMGSAENTPCHSVYFQVGDPTSPDFSTRPHHVAEGHMKDVFWQRPSSYHGYREEWQRLCGQWRTGRPDWSHYVSSQQDESTKVNYKTIQLIYKLTQTLYEIIQLIYKGKLTQTLY